MAYSGSYALKSKHYNIIYNNNNSSVSWGVIVVVVVAVVVVIECHVPEHECINSEIST